MTAVVVLVFGFVALVSAIMSYFHPSRCVRRAEQPLQAYLDYRLYNVNIAAPSLTRQTSNDHTFKRPNTMRDIPEQAQSVRDTANSVCWLLWSGMADAGRNKRGPVCGNNTALACHQFCVDVGVGKRTNNNTPDYLLDIREGEIQRETSSSSRESRQESNARLGKKQVQVDGVVATYDTIQQ